MPMIATEQKFGVFSDELMGIAETIPSIRMNKAFVTNESINMFLRYNEARRMRGRLKELLDSSDDETQTTDANPIIRYHRHFDSAGTEYLFCFTKAHVYRWHSNTKVYSTFFTCGSDCTLWDSVSFNGRVIITNNVDKIQVWNDATPGTAFTALDSSSGLDLDGGTTYLTKAKYLATYENYVLAGSTTEGGVTYPYRVRWCSHGDQTDWQSTGGSGDAGSKDFKEGPDVLKGFGHYNAYGADLLVVFKKESSYFQWLVESSEIFNTSKITYAGGLLATHSVINDKEGHLYYFANDYTIKKLKVGTISQRIDKTLRAISPTYQDYIEATFIDEYNHLCWSIPSSGSSTGNDKLVRLNLDEESWEFDGFAVRAFGDYSRQTTYTIDTIPFSTIDGITWETIDSVENIVGFPIDICSDYYGGTYDLHSAEKDIGDDYIGRLVLTTDLTDKQSLWVFKRLWNIQFFLKRKAVGTVEVSVKRDNENNWQSLGYVSMVDTEEPEIVRVDLPCDLRARNYLIKLEAPSTFGISGADVPSAFDLLGLVFSFAFDGER